MSNLVALDVANFLSDNGFGTIWTDIFIDEKDSKVEQVDVFNTGGFSPDYAIETQESIENPTITIHSVYNSRATAESVITRIRDLLDNTTNIQIGDYFYLKFWITNDVFYISRDSENRVTYGINIRIKRRKEE